MSNFGKYMLLIICGIILSLFGTNSYMAWASPPSAPAITELNPAGSQVDVRFTAPTSTGGSEIIGYYVTRRAGTETTFGEQPFTSRPISHWKFDGTSTGLKDFGSLANDLTLGGGTLTFDDTVRKIADSHRFDGSTFLRPNSADTPYDFQNSSPFSVSFWMKAGSQNNVAILSKNDGGYLNGKGWGIWLQSDPYINFNLDDGTNELRIRHWNPAILNNVWHHIVVTYDGTNSASGMKIYFDGVANAAATYTVSNTPVGEIRNSDALTIGAVSTYNTNKFSGWLDDVRIYNTKLTEPQITDLFNYNQIWPGTAIGAPNFFPDLAAVFGSTNTYKVHAVNRDGQGGSSNEMSVTLSGPPGAPAGLTVNPVSGTPPTNDLAWTAPAVPGGSSVSGYYIARMTGAGAPFTEQPFTAQPISHWKFDGTSTGLWDLGSLANDLSGGGGSVVYDSATPNNKIASSVNLDGTRWLTAPNEFSYDFQKTTTPFSVSFWMKAGSQNNVAILSKNDGGYVNSKGWGIWLQSDPYINFNLDDGTNELRIRYWHPTLLDNNNWYHVVVTYDGTNSVSGMKIYVNGVSDLTTYTVSNTAVGEIRNNVPLTIGAVSTYNTNKFTGRLDDVRIYDAPLTQSQITDLFNYNQIVSTTAHSDPSPPANSNYRVYATNTFGQGLPTSVGPGITPTVNFNQDSYQINHGGWVTVTDPSANTRDNLRDVITVQVRDQTTGGPPVRVPLTETTLNSGVFDNTGNLLLFRTGSNDDSIPALGVTAGDTIEVLYSDLPAQTAQLSLLPGTFTSGPVLGAFSVITCSQDIDADGICDTWEDPNLNGGFNGLRITTPSSNVYELGCAAGTLNPCPGSDQDDVYIEIDHMAGHAPSSAAINAVFNAFARQNIRLHVIQDEPLNFHYDLIYLNNPTGVTTPSFFDIKATHFGTPTERGLPNAQDKLNAKSQVFHYVLFAHSIENAGWSGFGEQNGNDIGVTLGSFVDHVGSPDQQAGTLLHELGHNLNLKHGGNQDWNCKPNYLSVMSYSRQFSDFIYDRPVDFSGTELTALDETSPNGVLESIGNAATSGLNTVFGGLNVATGQGFPVVMRLANNDGFDFDRDGITGETLSNQNVHYMDIVGCRDNTNRNLVGFNDWNNLDFTFSDSAFAANGVTINYELLPEEAQELTDEAARQMRILRLTAIEAATEALP